MFLYIREKKMELANDPDQIDVVISEINNYLKHHGLKLAHLIINNNLVYDDFYNYLLTHLAEVEIIEVVLLNPREIIDNTLIMTNDYVKSAVPLINALAESFYRQPDEQAWTSLDDLLEGVQWIIESLKRIDNFNDLETIINDYKVWNEYVQIVSEFYTIVPLLEQALVVRDYVSVGDQLMYEVVPIFKALAEKLFFLLPQQEENSVS